MKSHLTLALMNPPYESANTATALRIVTAALRAGSDVTVFAYEGAVSMAMRAQQPHANPVKGTSAEQERHPTTRDWIASLLALAADRQCKLDWINCGLCVDERGAGDAIEGVRRGSPKDFLEAVRASSNVLVIPTR
jgi:tRNA 2-thiouridine synthesizing protein D